MTTTTNSRSHRLIMEALGAYRKGDKETEKQLIRELREERIRQNNERPQKGDWLYGAMMVSIMPILLVVGIVIHQTKLVSRISYTAFSNLGRKHDFILVVTLSTLLRKI